MNSSETLDLIPFECDTTYNGFLGVLEYVGTVFYMVPGILMHLLIVRCVLITQKKRFSGSSFFLIFVTDSVASITLMLSDIVVYRIFLYISPLCPLIGPYFWSPSIIIRILYYIVSHARFAKCITQIFLVLNRMSCVLMPSNYTSMWTTLTPISIICVMIMPFFGIWNVLISPRIFLTPVFGGFGPNYQKVVPWAALSLFQSIYVLTTLGFTVICTTVTLYKLIFLTERIKSAERSLCFTSAFISMTFMLVAATQLCYVFCIPCRVSSWLFVAQFLAFDSLNVGSALIMMATNAQLRGLIFPSGKLDQRVFQMSTNSLTAHN